MIRNCRIWINRKLFSECISRGLLTRGHCNKFCIFYKLKIRCKFSGNFTATENTPTNFFASEDFRKPR